MVDLIYTVKISDGHYHETTFTFLNREAALAFAETAYRNCIPEEDADGRKRDVKVTIDISFDENAIPEIDLDEILETVSNDEDDDF